ncbi:DNA-3-methyladenine glycosylase [Mangrovibacterium diazotrophicum]|uniref:Putative 3-methyladenine DNA glycosylase n=1 Tax=Mangrovibacterium diazotrophicum TaxID=1261403 RepID=A0A419W981_9BACT|nr:DNA-3-methyladenine glycosylase [Mangrovibacterium diazotrophicum]RKD92009.1 DNA-3-methyladenine glycosylase [Mangrovibacterium diazotrophicum]
MPTQNIRLKFDFYRRDTVIVAQELLGKTLVRHFQNGTVRRYRITETEAYCGVADLACHASKGKTKRTKIMFHAGGYIYVYLIYGMYWLLNIVSGDEGEGSAVLIRGLDGFNGPGILGRELQLDASFYSENLETSNRIWLEDAPPVNQYQSTPRIGINYAGEPWISMPWRFVLK